ncbi:hypothetical protein AALO_G00285740, partial [Alosa alosa]
PVYSLTPTLPSPGLYYCLLFTLLLCVCVPPGLRPPDERAPTRHHPQPETPLDHWGIHTLSTLDWNPPETWKTPEPREPLTLLAPLEPEPPRPHVSLTPLPP